jgi:hypothetical protein
MMKLTRSIFSEMFVPTVSRATRAFVVPHARTETPGLTFVESAETARAEMRRATTMKIAFSALCLLRLPVHQVLAKFHKELAHWPRATMSG